MTKDELLQQMYEATLVGNAPEVKELTEQGLADGISAETLLYDSLIPSLEEVGARFERGDYFVPEMLIAARAMQGALNILRPILAETGAKPIGTFLMGTVKGDVHDIGKNLVNIMLEGAGFTVIDLGVNVAPETFVAEINVQRAGHRRVLRVPDDDHADVQGQHQLDRKGRPPRPGDHHGRRCPCDPGVRRCGRRRRLRGRRLDRSAAGQGPDREAASPPAGMTDVASLVAGASFEVTPKAAADVAALGDLLPAGTSIYITALPGADPANLVPAAVAVRAAGHVPVPHIAARGYADLDAVDTALADLVSEAQVDDVLVVAGGLKDPIGSLSSSLEILDAGLLEKHGIVRAGVAGHPEGCPDIEPAAAAEALVRKNEIARNVARRVPHRHPVHAGGPRLRAVGTRDPRRRQRAADHCGHPGRDLAAAAAQVRAGLRRRPFDRGAAQADRRAAEARHHARVEARRGGRDDRRLAGG